MNSTKDEKTALAVECLLLWNSPSEFGELLDGVLNDWLALGAEPRQSQREKVKGQFTALKNFLNDLEEIEKEEAEKDLVATMAN
jgi:hypothetical protein